MLTTRLVLAGGQGALSSAARQASWGVESLAAMGFPEDPYSPMTLRTPSYCAFSTRLLGQIAWI